MDDYQHQFELAATLRDITRMTSDLEDMLFRSPDDIEVNIARRIRRAGLELHVALYGD